MTLVLTITNVESLENGVSTRLTLDRHGAVIGRSPHADWSLPDPKSYVSSTHCEIDFRDGAYLLVDKSTNGTFLNGGQGRMASPHPIADGDVILIGHYQIAAQLQGDGHAPRAAPAQPEWSGWDSHGSAKPVGVDPASWDRPAPMPAISGQGPMSQNWSPPRVEAPPPPPSSAWGAATPAPAATPASDWSSPQSNPPPSAEDVWGRLAAGNTVDWARGGFGSAPAAAPDPLGLARAPEPTMAAAPTPTPAASWGAPTPAPTPAPLAYAQPAAPASTPMSDDAWMAFVAAAQLNPADLKTTPAGALSTAGTTLRKLVAGLVVLMEARARAKAQLGAQGTSLELDGNNPLKFARSPEKALAQLLNPPERGFMSTELAIEDAFRDLQAHQMATLAAMQGALAATLARFSPDSIRTRAETRGILAKILPSAREAALWQAYEREFEGVAQGSDEAFMDIFAKEFRKAYETVAADMKRKRT